MNHERGRTAGNKNASAHASQPTPSRSERGRHSTALQPQPSTLPNTLRHPQRTDYPHTCKVLYHPLSRGNADQSKKKKTPPRLWAKLILAAPTFLPSQPGAPSAERRWRDRLRHTQFPAVRLQRRYEMPGSLEREPRGHPLPAPTWTRGPPPPRPTHVGAGAA